MLTTFDARAVLPSFRLPSDYAIQITLYIELSTTLCVYVQHKLFERGKKNDRNAGISVCQQERVPANNSGSGGIYLLSET